MLKPLKYISAAWVYPSFFSLVFPLCCGKLYFTFDWSAVFFPQVFNCSGADAPCGKTVFPLEINILHPDSPPFSKVGTGKPAKLVQQNIT